MILKGKSILITGGTGSFGKEFVRQALLQQPKRIAVFSRDELKQYEMAKIYTDAGEGAVMRYFLGDVRDEYRLRKALKGVDIVIHAAAIKQVPAAEYNPSEAVATNINGTQNVINAALASNVKKVVLLSTDKAVEPCNLYGCTKAVAEKLMVNANLWSDHTRYSVVRYGNVMGSRGSVIPHFKDLAKNGESLTITNKGMTRFWVSLEDAVKFVLRTIQDMQGGEIFVPRLPSMKMVDLAIGIIEKARKGAKPCLSDSDIVYTGIRPGEKMHEKLISKNERNVKKEDDRFIIYPTYNIFSDDESYPLSVSTEAFDYSSNNAPQINIEEVI